MCLSYSRHPPPHPTPHLSQLKTIDMTSVARNKESESFRKCIYFKMCPDCRQAWMCEWILVSIFVGNE